MIKLELRNGIDELDSNTVASDIWLCHGKSVLTGGKDDFFAITLNPFSGDRQNVFTRGHQIWYVFPLEQMCKMIFSMIILEIC
jgi:hypothetical protein